MICKDFYGWLLTNCCYPETSFVVNLQFYNKDTGGTVAFQESRSE